MSNQRYMSSLNESRESNRFRTSRPIKSFATTAFSKSKCAKCNESHYTGHCEEFLRLNPNERKFLAANKSLCYNCLREELESRNSPSQSSCRNCRGSHHTLLHGAVSRPFEVVGPSAPKRRQLTTVATLNNTQIPSTPLETVDDSETSILGILPD